LLYTEHQKKTVPMVQEGYVNPRKRSEGSKNDPEVEKQSLGYQV